MTFYFWLGTPFAGATSKTSGEETIVETRPN